MKLDDKKGSNLVKSGDSGGRKLFLKCQDWLQGGYLQILVKCIKMHCF